MKQKKLIDVTPFYSLREMMEMAKNESADRTAYMYKDNKEVKKVTFSEFYEDVYSLGCALSDLGIEKTHIACVGENSYKWINTYLTVLCSDSVFVGIDKELPPDDFINILKQSDSTVLFYHSKTEPILRERAEEFSSIRFFIGLDRSEDDGRFLSFALLREKGREIYKSGISPYFNVKPDTSKLKMLVFTSGTTGLSKGVMLSEKNIISCVYNGLRVNFIYGNGLSVLPYHHTYEAVCGILVSIHTRTTICINESLRAIAKNMLIYKPAYIYVVPAIASALHKNIIRTAQKSGKLGALKFMAMLSGVLRKFGVDIRRQLFSSVHEALGGNLAKIVCGGAPVPTDTAKFFDTIGITLLNGYGITECSPLVSVNMNYDLDYKTVGHPLPCVEVKIDGADSDGIGEICVKGDTVMLGYYKDPQKTAEVIVDGWFYTGDYGYINKKGQLLITGRKKNIIVLDNGKNIYPEELEGYIYTLPYVQEVVVREAEDGGKKILCAEIFPDKAALADNDINDDICNVLAHLPIYKQIGKIVLRDTEFEKNTSQKIKR